MSDTTIEDVSNTLITFLRDNMSDIVPIREEIVLLSPGELQGQSVRLTLFLYSVIENPYLKNDERPIVNSTQTRLAPLSLDLYYLLSTYTPEGSNVPDPPLEAHRVLGRAMKIFYENGILAGSILEGSLAARNAELRLTLNPITVEDLTRIWSVFPNTSYRTSVSYLVTPARIDSDKLFSGQRVVSKQADMDHLVPKPRGDLDGTA